jgi:hypothetical protein
MKSSVGEDTDPVNFINGNDKIEFWLSLVEQGAVPLLEVTGRGYRDFSCNSHIKNFYSENTNYFDNDGKNESRSTVLPTPLSDHDSLPTPVTNLLPTPVTNHLPIPVTDHLPTPIPVTDHDGLPNEADEPINIINEKIPSRLFPEVTARTLANEIVDALIKVLCMESCICRSVCVHV